MKKTRFQEIVIWENENYLLVNKPAGLATLDDREREENLLQWAKDERGDVQACHRLDKETSGVLAFAKHPEAYRHVAIQFEKRKVTKLYHAITDGLHEFNNTKTSYPLYSLGKGVVVIDRERGKPAETIFNTLEAFKAHTLVACEPITGRMHQIRVHLQALKAPISGDETYGGQPILLSKIKRNFNLKQGTEELPVIRRVALHARQLEFADLDGKKLVVEAPYHKDFAVVLKQLRRFA
jgi:23S rRNA pseudouridine955/2504/2580 synthase